MERFEDTATEDEEEEFIAMQAVDRDTVDEVASEIEEEELPLESKKAVSLEKPKNMTVHPKSEEERKIVEDFNALQQRMAAMLARRTDETSEEQHVSDALNARRLGSKKLVPAFNRVLEKGTGRETGMQSGRDDAMNEVVTPV